jgi:hypothetical protein
MEEASRVIEESVQSILIQDDNLSSSITAM